jgi:NAD(P)-dependent dehydrogenase (short-subunit alcohol dehydrogenase family)
MGFGIAKALTEAGATVYINDLYENRAEVAAKKIGASALPGDITDPNIRDNFAALIPQLDILVNNAGVPEGMGTSIAKAATLTDADYQRQMDLNHHAIRGLCSLFVPTMQTRGHGRVLVISSEAHRLASPMGLSHYAAAKAATIGYMRALAAEVGRDGVTINALSLGAMNNFEGHEHAAAATIVGRAGSPEDVGAAALYLCSDEASWMTGQTIPLNGGASTA